VRKRNVYRKEGNHVEGKHVDDLSVGKMLVDDMSYVPGPSLAICV
jgi:hypothetical protein